MDITCFDDLLAAARAQPLPQRLLLVFAAAGVGSDATAEQRAAFAAGHGGELAPSMCVDKSPDEVASFDALAAESRRAGPPWAVVFAACLEGAAGAPLDSRAAEEPLRRMVERVRSGALGGMAAFDTSGHAVTLR